MNAASNTHGVLISVIPETSWQARLIAEIEALRDKKKDAMIHYDSRTNVLRVYEGRVVASEKLS